MDFSSLSKQLERIERKLDESNATGAATLQRLNDHQIQDTALFGEAKGERSVILERIRDLDDDITHNTERIYGVRKAVDKIKWAKWAGYVGGGGGVGAILLKLIERLG